MELTNHSIDFTQLAGDIKAWTKTLGFQQVGITACETDDADQRLQAWLEKQYHGEMIPALRLLMGNRIYGCDD